jgi:uncharacterized membrane protein YobD (UPF0266 family)
MKNLFGGKIILCAHNVGSSITEYLLHGTEILIIYICAITHSSQLCRDHLDVEGLLCIYVLVSEPEC